MLSLRAPPWLIAGTRVYAVLPWAQLTYPPNGSGDNKPLVCAKATAQLSAGSKHKKSKAVPAHHTGQGYPN